MIEKIRPYLTRIIAVVVLIVGLTIFLNLRTYGWVEVTVPKNDVIIGNASFTLYHDDQASQQVSVTPGKSKKVRVKTGLVRVDSNAGSIHSVDMIRINSFRTTKLAAPTGEQHAVKQLASGLEYCPVLIGDRVYSYDCLGEGPIMRHESPKLGNTRNVPLFDEQEFSGVKPIKGGLIGFTDADQSEERVDMFFINLNNETQQRVTLPANIPALSGHLPDLVVSTDPNSSKFALVFTQDNKIFLFDSIDDKNPALIEPKRAKTTETARLTRGSFADDRFVLYLGTSNDLHEGGGQDEGQDKAKAKLSHFVLEYDMDGKEVQVTYLPVDIDSQGIYKLSNDFYAAEDNEGFDFYHREDNGLKKVYSMTGMAGWTLHDGKAYVQNGNVLYEFVPKENGLFSFNSRFGKAGINVSRIFSSGGNIIFTAFATENSNDQVVLYRLLPELETGLYDGQASNSRIEPDYSDLRRLTDAGALTDYHVTNLRYALDAFIETLPAAPKEVLVDNIVVAPHDRFSDSIFESVTFDFTFEDNQKFRAKVDYSGVTDVNLTVSDTGGNQLFNSGLVAGGRTKEF